MEIIKNFQHTIINIIIWIILTTTMLIISPSYKDFGFLYTLFSILLIAALVLLFYLITGLIFDMIIRILLKYKLKSLADILRIVFILIPTLATLYILNIIIALVRWK